MKIRTEIKHVIELDDKEVNDLYHQLVNVFHQLGGSSPPALSQLRDALWPIRNGH